ncbi:MAG: formate dehydrogenase accessory protein FdhE, partial [Candidatus Rokuibacteriota bacterium]
PEWSQGYCPVCGGWPTLAEARGLERSRQLRCGPCGGDWRTTWLRCPYCGNDDHHRLGSLVPDGGGETRKVETCEGCRGYIKTLATLTPRAGAGVMLEDLATVDLDVAALEQGYERPQPRAVDVRLIPRERRGWSIRGRRR